MVVMIQPLPGRTNDGLRFAPLCDLSYSHLPERQSGHDLNPPSAWKRFAESVRCDDDNCMHFASRKMPAVGLRARLSHFEISLLPRT
jgi:hypothetical protein